MEQLYTWLWIFFLYAFLGWCCEVVFAAVKTGKFVNRGFLLGPVCPIYGMGVALVLWALLPLEDNLLVLYFGSVLITSAISVWPSPWCGALPACWWYGSSIRC